MTVPEVLGVVGFVLSVALGAAELWEKFFRRSKFEPFFEWGYTNRRIHVLEFSIANVGWKKDSIRTFTFRYPHPRQGGPENLKWLEWEVGSHTWPEIPMVLDVNEVTPRFELDLAQLEKGVGPGLPEHLLAGDAELIVTNARGKERVFPIPTPSGKPSPPSPEDIHG